MNTTYNLKTCLLYGSDNFDMNSCALVDLQASESSQSFEQFYQLVSRFESVLIKQGIKKGSHVLICGKNSIEIVAMILATWRTASIAIPVDYRMTVNEIVNCATSVGSNLVVISDEVDIKAVKEKLDTSKTPVMSIEQCLNSEYEKIKSNVEEVEDFPALVILTSGTTGHPKGAVHTYYSLVDNLLELADLVSIKPDKKLLVPLPVSHIFGLEVLLICILKGATAVFCDLEPKSFIQSINKLKPNVIAGVPTIYGALLTQGSKKVDLENAEVLLSGGAPLPIPMARKFEAEFSKRLNNGYGSTESKLVCLNIDGPLESVGKPIPSVIFHIVDENGKVLPEGEEGEIYIKSNLLMKEYLNQPEKTQEVITENGYKTGDIGYLKDGYLFISGRAKEMIIVAGNKVFPIEVEQALGKNELVKEVAVTGQEHRRLGQIVKATIVISDTKISELLKSDDENKVKEARETALLNLKDYSKQNLKRELRPMVWDLKPADQPLPKTRSGKIDKKAL